jgi:hypothetical protein
MFDFGVFVMVWNWCFDKTCLNFSFGFGWIFFILEKRDMATLFSATNFLGNWILSLKAKQTFLVSTNQSPQILWI